MIPISIRVQILTCIDPQRVGFDVATKARVIVPPTILKQKRNSPVFADKKVAVDVLSAMDKVIGQLNESLVEIRDTCPDPEFVEYRRAVGGVMAEIYIRIREKIYLLYPDL